MVGQWPTTEGELTGLLLSADGFFAAGRVDNVVPLPSSGRMDACLARRLCVAGAAMGTGHAMVGSLDADRVDEPLRRVGLTEQDLLASVPWRGFVLTLPDLVGVAYVNASGYALVGGDRTFVAACLSEGMDTVRAQFARYARRLATRRPVLITVADRYPPKFRSARNVHEVRPGTTVAEQLDLMDRFVRGELDGAGFTDAWLAAYRTARDSGERTRADLAYALNEVFFAIDEYTPDPELREPGDPTDADLRARVGQLLGDLRGKSATG